MYRLRFAGKYVEQKKNTFERKERGPDESAKASRELRKRLADDLQKEKLAQRKLRQAQLRDQEILRELNLAKFDEARFAKGQAETFQEKFGYLSEQFNHLSEVEEKLRKKLLDMENSRTKRELATRATPAMLLRDLELLERLLETRQQQISQIRTNNDDKKEKINGLRVTLTLQKERLLKLETEKSSKERNIVKLVDEELDSSKSVKKTEEGNALLQTMLSEDVKNFKVKWKLKMEELHLAHNRKKKEAVKDKAHEKHAGQFQEMRHKASMENILMLQKKQKMLQKKQYIDTMEEAFETITNETGIESLDELVDTFLRSEHRNFSVYKHINELNRNIEEAVAENRVLKVDISRYSKEYSKTGISRREKVTTLDDDRIRLEKKIADYRFRTSEMETNYHHIQPLVLKLFRLMGCDQFGLNKELVVNGVTDGNTSTVLGIMEQQATNISNLFRKLLLGPNPQISNGHIDEPRVESDQTSLEQLTQSSVKPPIPPQLGDFDPHDGDGKVRGSMLSVAPIDVTNLRSDVKSRVETGNYRQRSSHHRKGMVIGVTDLREEQMKEIKALQRQMAKKVKSLSDDDSGDDSRKRQSKRRRDRHKDKPLTQRPTLSKRMMV